MIERTQRYTHMVKNNRDETEEVLQAVVVADSFNARFMPLTYASPRVILTSYHFLISYHYNIYF